MSIRTYEQALTTAETGVTAPANINGVGIVVQGGEKAWFRSPNTGSKEFPIVEDSQGVWMGATFKEDDTMFYARSDGTAGCTVTYITIN